MSNEYVRIELGGKTIYGVEVLSTGRIDLIFEDRSVLKITAINNRLNLILVEPTLDSNVVPVGANTLGEGSV